MRIPGQVTGLRDRDLIFFFIRSVTHVDTISRCYVSWTRCRGWVRGGHELWILHFILISSASVCVDVRTGWHTNELVWCAVFCATALCDA